MFEHDIFRANAKRFWTYAADYEALGLNDMAAAEWANMGFLPHEAAPHIEAGRTPAEADKYDSVARKPWAFRKN